MTDKEAARLLKLRLPATRSQIKKAYHTIALRSHPDLHPGNSDAHSRMVAASEAYTMLLAFASTQPCVPQPCKPTPKPTPTPKASFRRAAAAPTEPAIRHRVVWSGPPTANSEFFETRGFLVRPTEGRVTFRVMKAGRHFFTLERHRDDPELLICRNERGEFETIDGVAFWLDDGTSIVPYIEGRI